MNSDPFWGSNIEFQPAVNVLHTNSSRLGEENHAAPGLGTVGFFTADQQARAWRCPALRQQVGRCRSCFLSGMNEYLPDHHRVFDTGNYLDGTTTFATGFNIDGKYPFQSLGPSH